MDNQIKSKKIGLIQVDGKLPNLALLKLDKFYSDQGCQVTYIDISSHQFDQIFASKIFIAGSGYDLQAKLPPEIEEVKPDYEKFNLNYSFGFTSRGCVRGCEFCIVQPKEGYFHEVSYEWTNGEKRVLLLDNNFFLSKIWKEKLQHFIDTKTKVCFNQGLDIRLIDEEKAEMLSKVLYYDDQFKTRRLYFAFDKPEVEPILAEKIAILGRYGIKQSHLMFFFIVNFNTTHEQDYHRFEVLDKLGTKPYPMCYQKWTAPKITKDFLRWINRRYYKICTFEDYLVKVRKKR
ncbi:MAG: hypothetical protein WC365_07970 [Candidatus Babeliales bacterium]|jgi:hypothetical protein